MTTDKSECGRCGRALKDRKSVQRGYGPVCWKKHLAEVERIERENNPEELPSQWEAMRQAARQAG